MPDGSRQGRRFLKTDKLQVNNFEMPESRTKSSVILISFFFSVFFYILACWLACSSSLISWTSGGLASQGPTDW
jgi:hypothetical protein